MTTRTWPTGPFATVLIAWTGCTGVIGDGGAALAPRASDPASPRAPGASPVAGVPAAPGGEGPRLEPGEVRPGPLALRRLTNDEYDRTVSALLGAAPGTSDRYRFREDPVDGEGYDNLVVGLGISEDRVFEYREAAQGLAAEVMASPGRRQQVVGCDLQAQGTACLTAFIRSFGRRAFRAPLEQAELDRLLKLAQLAPSAAGPFGGATLALEAMLQSARFLFRVEIGVPDQQVLPQKPPRLRLSGYELATRLAYLLWGTTPDDALLDAAASGLDTADKVAARAAMMLADARGKAGLRRFASAWLRHTTFDRRPNTDPAWTPALLADAREETLRLFERQVWPQGADFFALLTARATEVTAALAKIYGVTAAGGGWQPATFDARSERNGLLTQASFLALTGGGGAMLTPVLRGQFVREVLLCQPIPSPPADAAMAAMDAATASNTTLPLRQRWDATLAGKPACRACHDLMNPVGFGLERFDRVGRLVDKGARGEPLTGEGRLNVAGVEHAFTAADGLAKLLVERPEVADCVVKQLHRFAHGAPATDQDGAAVQQLGERLRRSRDFKTFVTAFVSSDAFRYGLPQ